MRPDDATTRDLGVPDAARADEHLAYAAVADDADSFTVAGGEAADAYPDYRPEPADTRKPFLTAMGVLTVFVVGVVTLVLALAISIRPHVRQRPDLGQKIVVPAQQAPAAPASPVPQAPVPAGSAPAPVAPAPAPVPPPAAPPIQVPALPQLPLPGPPAAPPPGPQLPLPGRGPGLPGPGIPGPRVPVPGPAIPHLPVPHLPGIPGL
jgi:hypothetical protein